MSRFALLADSFINSRKANDNEGGGAQMLHTGTYKTQSGETVHVTRTATGYVIRYSDGTTTVIGES